MSKYLDYKFQFYMKGIKNIKPSGEISLRQLINAIISPKKEMLQAFEAIKEAGQRGDKAEKDRLKEENLFFTTPSATFKGIRNYESIQEFTPFAVFEYDDIPHAEELRDYIFEKRKDCIFAFCSPSFTGCKFIFYIDVPTSIQHYKELWLGIAYDLDKFKNLDMSNERCTQPLYNSYDPNAKFREDAVQSFVRGYKENAFVPFSGEPVPPGDISDEDVKECFNLIRVLIDRIEDSAHNQLISAALLAGSLCAYYNLNQDDMWALLEERIRDNAYMSKGVPGYLKSAQTMLRRGLGNPYPLKKD